MRRVAARRRLYDGHVGFVVLELEDDDGGRSEYAYAEPPPFVAAIVVTADGHAVLVRQERPPLGEALLEIPAGGIAGDETPEHAIRREVREECLLEIGELIDLGLVVMSPGTSSERGTLFLARDCRPAADAEQREPVERVRMPLAELVERVGSGELVDAKAAAAIGRALARGLLDAQ